MTPGARNALAEANRLLPPGYEGRVLEPSPPAVHDGEWFADDPTDVSGATARVVSPGGCGDVSWSQLAAEDPRIAEYAADHWLGGYHRLGPLPPDFGSQRADLHRVAFHVLSTAREEVTGKIALRFTYQGFGTPFFGEDRQVRVQGMDLVVQEGDDVRVQRLTTLNEAADFVGVTYDPTKAERFDSPRAIDGNQPLNIGAAAAFALADWFGFGYSVLEDLRFLGRTDHDVSRVQLWAEHFDPAVEIGSATDGQRASYGASPGDNAHSEPYLYVGAWGEIDRSNPFWNDDTFNGASLGYRELLASNDQRQTALDFYRQGLEILTRD